MNEPRDFFVTYNGKDEPCAIWIAAALEAAGYTTAIAAWDFRPGDNFIAAMDRALTTCRHTIGVLSPDYLASVFTRAEWTAAYRQTLLGKPRGFIPVRIVACDLTPLLGTLAYIDLAGIEESEARRRLLAGVAGRAERVARGGFPRSRAAQVRFPKTPQEVWDLRGHRADPHFIGRDDVLSALHRDLRAGRPTSAVQVIIGLGGQGKTGLVVEYAHRYAAAYDLA